MSDKSCFSGISSFAGSSFLLAAGELSDEPCFSGIFSFAGSSFLLAAGEQSDEFSSFSGIVSNARLSSFLLEA